MSTKISTISPGLAKEYDASAAYAVDEYVLRQNAYWRCISSISSPGENWNPAHWQRVDYPLTRAEQAIAGKQPRITASGILSGNGQGVVSTATLDTGVSPNSANPVRSSGIWAALWGELQTAPSSSLYDWCRMQSAGQLNKEEPDVYSFVWGSELGGDGLAIRIPGTGDGSKYYVFDNGISRNDSSVLRYADLPAAVPGVVGLRYRVAEAMPTARLPAGVTFGPAADHPLSCALSFDSAEDIWTLTAEEMANSILCTWVADGTSGSLDTSWGFNFYSAGGNVLANVPDLVLAPPYVLADRTVNLVVAKSGETSISVRLPDAVESEDGTRYARDLIVDVDNSGGSGAVQLTFSGLGTEYAFICSAEGEAFSDLVALNAGERARFWISEMSFTASGGLPVLGIARALLTGLVTSNPGD